MCNQQTKRRKEEQLRMVTTHQLIWFGIGICFGLIIGHAWGWFAKTKDVLRGLHDE